MMNYWKTYGNIRKGKNKVDCHWLCAATQSPSALTGNCYFALVHFTTISLFGCCQKMLTEVYFS